MNDGRHKYTSLLKSLIQRIEFHNVLAPKHHYGRHRQKGLKKKKKNTIKGKSTNEEGAVGDEGSEYVVDENYYDLDDGWIDDGDLEDHEDIPWDLV